MTDFKQYYEQELRYLTEGGREFGEAFPEIANYLNLNAVDDRDPYVERLFEGFAFLTGRIREKLEDDFPELTENVLEIAAPDFLRPIPSLAILQFFPRPGIMQQSYTVPKDTEVLSNPAGEELTVCRFRTTRDVTVHPMQLSRVEQLSHPSRGSGLKFSFSMDEGTDSEIVRNSPLPMFLHGDRSIAWMLHYLLTEKTTEVVFESEAGRMQFVKGKEPLVKAGGFGAEQYLLPMPKNALESGRCLHEFFAFDEKFRFAEFSSRLFAPLEEETEFSLTLYFDQSPPSGKRIKADLFKLYATPVINVFEHQGEPISLDHRHFEYGVVPMAGEQFDVYDIREMRGIDKVTGRERKYHRFSEFRHAVCRNGDRAAGNYFNLNRRNSEGKGFRCTVSLGSQGRVEEMQEEYLSLSLLSTNGSVPRKEILEKDICSPVAGFPEFISFYNITRPSSPVYPPRSEHYLWIIISHMNMNFRTLCEKDILQEMLSLYDWSRKGANQKLIRGILGVSAKKKSFMLDSQLVHGTSLTVTFKDGTFSEKGEENIFGKVLLEFLTRYSSVNYLVSLTFLCEPSGASVTWEPIQGTCHSI